MKKKQAKKQTKAENKKQKPDTQTKRIPVQVTISMNRNGSVDVSSTFNDLPLARGIVEEGRDVLCGAGEVRYNDKQRYLDAQHIKSRRTKQRQAAAKWNHHEKARLNKHVGKDK